MSRDNARTPMQWDASPHAGFTSGTPWLAVNPNHGEINAEAARGDADSVFHHYRRLIELRHTEAILTDGDFELLLPHDERVYAFVRRLEGEEWLVLGNFSGDPVAPEIPDAASWSEMVIGEPPAHGLALQPWEGRVHRRRKAQLTAS